ncbi:putative quinol monooxygenase [Aestuariivivens sediminicola]|uniref:putative quinol monooxygenase n=1 Tax=Aestuariivivens sediminicola TaxID=2913560 RepID=UPI001F57FF37|nr:antibiotic biosynthesis monooxygenase family protein [Aestuariivivens sediminicola]
MIVRIVKMGICPEHIDTFVKQFMTNKADIMNFKGCDFLELYKDTNDPTLYFTYSFWKSESALEHYRKSELFKTIWAKTKPLFNKKPEAWSLNRIETI